MIPEERCLNHYRKGRIITLLRTSLNYILTKYVKYDADIYVVLKAGLCYKVSKQLRYKLNGIWKARYAILMCDFES